MNRAAGHNYFLLDKFEAGIELRGTEVKSIREGKAILRMPTASSKTAKLIC